MHYMDVGSTYEKVLCRNCPRLVGEDSHAQEQTRLPLKKCKYGRRYHEIKRLVVAGNLQRDRGLQLSTVQYHRRVHRQAHDATQDVPEC